MNDPIKCPDCGTWWRGQEHKCAPVAETLPEIATGVEEDLKRKIKEKHKKVKGCPLCGAHGVHYCQGKKIDYSYKCHRCGKMHDYRYAQHCDDKGYKGWYKN